MVIAVVWLLVAARDGLWALVLQLPVIAFVGVALYVFCIRPIVAVGKDGVYLRNVVRNVWVPWGALAEISTQYALTLTMRDGARTQAWAAPAPSRFSAARATPSDLASIGWDDDDPPPASASLRADSGAAAVVVRRAWAAAQQDDRLGSEPAQTTWAWGPIAALVVTLALSVATFLG